MIIAFTWNYRLNLFVENFALDEANGVYLCLGVDGGSMRLFLLTCDLSF
jgi:hypothetical protein